MTTAPSAPAAAAAAGPMIRITAIPPGEAPEPVRRAWIGLELPLAGPVGGTRTVHTGGVISGPRGLFGALLGLLTGRVKESQGWVVKVKPAMAVLAQHAPEAEAWWRQNVPRMFEGERSFVFAASCAQLVGRQPMPEPEKAGRITAGTPTWKMVRTLAILLAIDVLIPLGWRYQALSLTSIKLWVVLVVSAGLTVVVGLFLLARLRANRQREIDRQM